MAFGEAFRTRTGSHSVGGPGPVWRLPGLGRGLVSGPMDDSEPATTSSRRNPLAAPGAWGSVSGMKGPPTTNSPATLAQGPLLRPEEATHLLSVKTSWVYEAVRAGRVPCLRVGRHIRFTRHMLEDWLAEQAEL